MGVKITAVVLEAVLSCLLILLAFHAGIPSVGQNASCHHLLDLPFRFSLDKTICFCGLSE